MGYLTQQNIGGADYTLAGALFGLCQTSSTTPAKTVTLPAFDSVEENVTIYVRFINGAQALSTLNVNSTGAVNVYYNNSTTIPDIPMNSIVAFTYVIPVGSSPRWQIPWMASTTDTKNTAGSNPSTSKMYLIGSTSQTTGSGSFQTYSNSAVYATNGALVCDTISTDGTNAYDLGAACAKGVDTTVSAGSTSTNVPTTAAVASYVDSAVSIASAGALTYKGVATALTDITGTNYKQGWYWMVGSDPDITIDGQKCEPGDMIIAKQDKTATANNDLDVIQANIETLTTTEIDTLWAAA